ncbi:ComEC/Rec2 family competence protein [Campylobacter insulaenigrae]|uniref:ComEC/Rec2 family competence protein n=1 Tax=Campylobacter insulaenigrae TaxID=260714 RepID=UPI0021537742|nr:ComEC/Rec2 family competence protein [Campylobacter insulaenigrae]MCR6572373.1 ComEC/Rec2 family competence protein [Campylobacter insulaenigrae]MCR6582110.1 ComEC/Rec2 family competence protein [Campylobacter insulaenigrae]MCR6584219.1 ComEC/Rec2 family competence protein [Campylobacter insulaenigrae]
MNFKFSVFKNYREFSILFLCFLIILLLNLFYEYKHYQNFKLTKHLYLKDNIIISSHVKENTNGKRYQILKLKNSDFTLYTLDYKILDLDKNKCINLRIITKNVNFKDYLSKNFFAPSYDINQTTSIKQDNFITRYFLNQHQNSKIIEFYGALFFAKSISHQLRQDINFYGIAHLIAISGYHLGLLFSFCFFIFTPIYAFFQKRYFPYRSLKFDISLLVFTLLISYTFLINFPPSYIRALCMALLGFYFYCKNINILSFNFLFLSIVLCISIFPQLIFSVGFLFSILGVFYIYLYIHHFKNYFSNLTHIILLNFWTFLAMILPVLYFFPLLSLQQFLAIPLSILFIIFYPLVLLLHIIGYGNFLDNILIYFFDIKFYSINFKISFYIYLAYLLMSIFAIFNKYLALFVVSLGFIPFIFLI